MGNGLDFVCVFVGFIFVCVCFHFFVVVYKSISAFFFFFSFFLFHISKPSGGMQNTRAKAALASPMLMERRARHRSSKTRKVLERSIL